MIRTIAHSAKQVLATPEAPLVVFAFSLLLMILFACKWTARTEPEQEFKGTVVVGEEP